AGSTPLLRSSSGTIPSFCSASATSRCSGSSCGLLLCCASSIAAATASRAFSVYLLIFICARCRCRAALRRLGLRSERRVRLQPDGPPEGGPYVSRLLRPPSFSSPPPAFAAPHSECAPPGSPAWAAARPPSRRDRLVRP